MEVKGTKHDDGKAEWHLVPWAAMQKVVQVLSHGAKKYSANNWQHVHSAWSRYFDAAMRHMIAWAGGESVDPESGMPHLAHAVCCLLFLMCSKETREDTDGQAD